MWIFPSIIWIIFQKKNIIVGNGTEINKIHSLIDLYNAVEDEIIYSLNLENKEIFYSNPFEIVLNIKNFDDKDNYKIDVCVNGEKQIENREIKQNEIISVMVDDEGINNININIYKNDISKANIERAIYYIKPYARQFLDEISTVGIATHFGLNSSNRDDFDKSYKLLTSLGTFWIRDSIRWDKVQKENGEYNFDNVNDWIMKIKENNINILAILAGGNQKQLGSDYQISSELELAEYKNYVEEVSKQYPFIKFYEIWNEPNSSNSNELYQKWYSKMVEESKKVLKDRNLIAGAVIVRYKKEIESVKWLKGINTYNFTDIYSYHPYASNNDLKYINNLFKSGINEFGGFSLISATEYGKKTSDENDCSAGVIQQNIINQQYNVSPSILYQLRTNNINNNYDYGLLNYDYTPKPAYYAMKNYYENTNGAEYIGTVNIAEGLEAHVYDKDGKPVIITWSENSTNNIQIDYKDFTAKDLYGKDIQPDENGKLTITTSPVYLYDVDYNYFYKAISNVATSKYDEFKEKFTTEISQISGFEEKINQRQNYIQSVANTQKLMQNTAITAMKSHYELGDIILKAYEEGKLKAEPVKISSMLDMINDIGNSYEDLVTVSVNNTINSVMKTLDEANVDSSELTTTKQKIDETENLINTNTDVEIIYPTKILQFSKDCYEKADYINSLEEQNDIKAGLIISNNLHAQLLADWANKFASIQINNNINDYIAQNPVTIEYSETNITNKSIKATIKTNAEIQITNNSNSKEYVFDQNGSFTFEYTIKGQAKQITAKVTNIDKTSPIINGVVDGKLYTSKITLTITDENLDTIKLILNGEEVKNFKSVTTLTEEGFYTLTAIDKAGNKTQISFQIMENNNQNYIIQDNIIKNISEQTKKSDFDNKLKLELTYKITRNDEEINETDNIATGDVLTTSAGDKYTLIVTGDLNKDGKLNLKDLVKMRKYFLDGNNLDENEMLAADCNFDGKINLKDLVKMRLMLLNQDATK